MTTRDYLLHEDWVGAVRRIQIEVCQKHGISLLHMLSPRRARRFAWPRQEAYWRASEETACSLPQIGLAFGGRDHTTIMHGIKRHEQRRGNGDL